MVLQWKCSIKAPTAAHSLLSAVRELCNFIWNVGRFFSYSLRYLKYILLLFGISKYSTVEISFELHQINTRYYGFGEINTTHTFTRQIMHQSKVAFTSY